MKKSLISILHLHKNSGPARTVLENIHYFKAKGMEVHVATMTIDKDLLKSEGIILHKMIPWFKGTGFTRRRWFNWQVQRLRKSLQPVVTVGHGDLMDQEVLTLHDCVFLASELINGTPLAANHEMSRTHGPILQGQRFKKMIANSELMKRDTIQRFHVPESYIQVVYPALDTQTFYQVVPQKRKLLRERFGFTHKLVVALVTSGNFKKRGVDILIEAIALLDDKTKYLIDVRIVGKDDLEPFKNLVTKKGLSNIIRFDPSLGDIQNYYNAIDIFVLPARIEEFGRVVLEAMACGVPVITSDMVGAGELLNEGSKEFVVPAEKPEALAKALKKLILDSDLRFDTGQLNARLALNDAEDKLSKKFDKVFNEFIY